MACLHDKMNVLKGHGFYGMVGKNISNCRVLSFIFLKIKFLNIFKFSRPYLTEIQVGCCKHSLVPKRLNLLATAHTPNLLRI